MEREKLIKKWLDNELTAAEQSAFQQLEDYDAIIKVSDTAKLFAAPAYQKENELKRLQSDLLDRKKPKSLVKRLQPFMQVAAVAIIAFGIYFVSSMNNDTVTNTLAAQKTTISLPDNSEVVLNASSRLAFNEKSWDDTREVKLDGEAYFKVAKGSKFSVQTKAGIVSVLGTQFNVKNRKDYFEVICYEGVVSVNYNNKLTKLAAGKSIRVVNGTIMKEMTTAISPSWTNNTSSFKSIPLKQVLDELARQYNLKLKIEKVDTQQLYTGSFSHNDQELALKSVTLPFNLTYSIDKNTVRITAGE